MRSISWLQESLNIATSKPAYVVYLVVILWCISVVVERATHPTNLLCATDGVTYKHIPQESIHYEIDGVWVFDGGYSANCKVFK